MFEAMLKFWLMPRGSVRLMTTTSPQLEMFTGIGAMKSLISDVNELPEERLFRYAEPRWKHVPWGKRPAPVRLMPASPNVESLDLTAPFRSSVWSPGRI